MLDRRLCGGCTGRGQGGGEDEAGGEAADEVDEFVFGGDVAADDAEGFAKRAFDHVDPVGEAAFFGHATAARAVHADGVNLVDVGEGTVGLANLDDFADGRDVAVHRVDGFKGHDLRAVADGVKLAVKVAPVVVLPQDLVGPGVADAFDHRGVVLFVRQDHRVRDL